MSHPPETGEKVLSNMIGVSHLSAGQLLCWLLVFPGSFADQTVLDFVDPFIGTDKGGSFHLHLRMENTTDL